MAKSTTAIRVPKLPLQLRAHTTIVATVGPACEQKEQLAELVKAGVDVFRLNMAHGSPKDHSQTLERIEELASELDLPVGVLVDLAGPKIRLGELAGGEVHCNLGEEFLFMAAESSDDSHRLPTTYAEMLDDLSPGDVIMLADGTVSMEVVSRESEGLKCRTSSEGTIRSRQGINFPGVALSAPTLGPEDREHAKWAAEAGIDYISLSFVRSADDIQQLRDLLDEQGSQASIVAKIEKQEALDQLDAIVEAADAVMVARGDLGVEIDVARMAIEQKRIITTCNRLKRPVIIATQMLESMTDSPRPTRAEATDVANAIYDGGDACMLSGETAIGKHPAAAVRMMNRIALATEAQLAEQPPPDPSPIRARGVHEVSGAVVRGAARIGRDLQASLIVVASHSGATALSLSKTRSPVPTIGVSDSKATLRKMCLYWGVMPMLGPPAKDIVQLVVQAEQWGRAAGFVSPGDHMVVLGGSQLTPGIHNMMLVHEVNGD